MNDTTQTPDSAPLLANATKVLLWEGIVLLILGSVAIAVPAIFTLAIELVVGAVFLIGGITRLWRSLCGRLEGTQFWNIIAAAAAIIVGILLLANPLQGAETLTVIIAVLLLIEGGAKLAAGFAIRPGNGWGFTLGFDRSDDQRREFDSIETGVYVDLNSRFRFGGSIRFSNPDNLVSGPELQERAPEVKFETGWRF